MHDIKCANDSIAGFIEFKIFVNFGIIVLEIMFDAYQIAARVT